MKSYSSNSPSVPPQKPQNSRNSGTYSPLGSFGLSNSNYDYSTDLDSRTNSRNNSHSRSSSSGIHHSSNENHHNSNEIQRYTPFKNSEINFEKNILESNNEEIIQNRRESRTTSLHSSHNQSMKNSKKIEPESIEMLSDWSANQGYTSVSDYSQYDNDSDYVSNSEQNIKSLHHSSINLENNNTNHIINSNLSNDSSISNPNYYFAYENADIPIYVENIQNQFLDSLSEEKRLNAQLQMTNSHIQRLKDQIKLFEANNQPLEPRNISYIKEHNDEFVKGYIPLDRNQNYEQNNSYNSQRNQQLLNNEQAQRKYLGNIDYTPNSSPNDKDKSSPTLDSSADRYDYKKLKKQQESLINLMSHRIKGPQKSPYSTKSYSPETYSPETYSPEIKEQYYSAPEDIGISSAKHSPIHLTNQNEDSKIHTFQLSEFTFNSKENNQIQNFTPVQQQSQPHTHTQSQTHESLYLSNSRSASPSTSLTNTTSPKRTNYMSPTKSSLQMSKLFDLNSSGTPRNQYSPSPNRRSSELVDASNNRKIIQYSPKDLPEDRLLKAHLSAKLRSVEAQLSKQKNLRKEPLLHKSKNSRPTSPAHVDKLMKKQQEIEAKIELKKIEAQKKELEEVTGIPIINENSKKIAASKRNKPIHERLFYHQQELIAKKEKKLIEKKLSEETYSFQPEINHNSEVIDRRSSLVNDFENREERMLQWGEEKKRKIEMLREMKEKKNLIRSPRINSRSDKIASNSDKAILKVEDRLILYAEEKKLEQEVKKRQHERDVLKQAHPQINSTSPVQKNISLDKSFETIGESNRFEKLYSVSQEWAERKQHLREKYDNESMIDKETGQQRYAPTINARSAALIRHLPVEDILTMKGENTKHKIDRLKSEELVRKKQLVEEKKVNAFSELLLTLKAKRESDGTENNSQSPNQRLSKTTKEHLEAIGQEHTFKPQINDKSRKIEMSKNPQNTSPRYETLIKKKEEYEAKKLRLQEHLINEELAECTFKPSSQSNVSSSFLYHSPYTARPSHQTEKSATKQMTEEIFIYYQ